MNPKLRLVLAVAGLIFACGTMSAQVVPGSITLSRGSFYDADGNVIRDSQAESVFGTALYEETYCGARRQYKTGRTILIIGSAIAVNSAIYTGIFWSQAFRDDHSDEMNESSGMMFALGSMFFCGMVGGLGIASYGIPFMVIGSKRLAWLESEYNSRQGTLAYNPLQRPQPFLTLGPSSYGVGLRLNF